MPIKTKAWKEKSQEEQKKLDVSDDKKEPSNHAEEIDENGENENDDDQDKEDNEADAKADGDNEEDDDDSE